MYFDCELYYKWFIERNNSNTKGIYLTKFPQPRTRLVGCFYSSGIICTPYIYYVLCIYYNIRYSRWLAQSRFIISRLIYYCLKKKKTFFNWRISHPMTPAAWRVYTLYTYNILTYTCLHVIHVGRRLIGPLYFGVRASMQFVFSDLNTSPNYHVRKDSIHYIEVHPY